MADERCVFPGENPRPPGRWLDRDAAERLLRGEPLAAVDAHDRNQVDELTRALAALVPAPAPGDDELPGEASALAAFRKVRADAAGEVEQTDRRGRTRSASHITGAYSSDAGLIRLGRPDLGGRRVRWGRPTRLGLAAALAAGMIGGVAVATGTGMLPTPFGDDRPGPTASVTAAATPERPLVSPSPDGPGDGGSPAGTPDGATSGSSVGGSSKEEAGGRAPGGQQGSDGTGESGLTGEEWSQTRASCRDVLDGKELDAGRRRVLEEAAGGSGQGRLKKYCNEVLDQAGTGTGTGTGTGADDSKKSAGDEDSKDSGGNSESTAETRLGQGFGQSAEESSAPGDGGGDDGGNHILPLLPLQASGNDGGGHKGAGGDDGRGHQHGKDKDDRGNGHRGNDVRANGGTLTPAPSPSPSSPGPVPVPDLAGSS
ncbi:hypothetical protein ACFYPC_21690 [Streptomyces sp. NPDC005808]|uniref:hypothetical protein n=1 Tax=Streptomyces sp. NPDC005808 TaxID=3364734 RepID=UPI0036A4D39E